MDFMGRNQHHIRSQVYPSSAISGLLEDLADDLRRFVPGQSCRRPPMRLSGQRHDSALS